LPGAVIFDLDGVLVDSESVWSDARSELVAQTAATWREDAQRTMMGMSSAEWSRYMREELGVPLSAPEISARVAERVEAVYRERLPLIAGARDAVHSLAQHWPLAIASSANRSTIALVPELVECFEVVVSSEEVANGKPSPDVYLEAARRLGCDPARCVVVEDSANGLRAGAAAGMSVIAIPNRAFPPGAQALQSADVVLESIEQLRPEVVIALCSREAPNRGPALAADAQEPQNGL
jgi:HAD superfamily hydrolase (TIGR01509 family)